MRCLSFIVPCLVSMLGAVPAGGAVPPPFPDPRQPPAVADLPAITVNLLELNERVTTVGEGATLADVREMLGGTEYETRERDGKVVRFWRFRIVDAADAQSAYQIWMGEFAADRLVFGAVLPQG
jgi:hypothetical protein